MRRLMRPGVRLQMPPQSTPVGTSQASLKQQLVVLIQAQKRWAGQAWGGAASALLGTPARARMPSAHAAPTHHMYTCMYLNTTTFKLPNK